MLAIRMNVGCSVKGERSGEVDLTQEPGRWWVGGVLSMVNEMDIDVSREY